MIKAKRTNWADGGLVDGVFKNSCKTSNTGLGNSFKDYAGTMESDLRAGSIHPIWDLDAKGRFGVKVICDSSSLFDRETEWSTIGIKSGIMSAIILESRL